LLINYIRNIKRGKSHNGLILIYRNINGKFRYMDM